MRFLLLFAAMMQFLNFMPPQEKPSIQFAQDIASLTFPKTASFSTTISSGEKITDVELLYGSDERTCSDVQALVIPDFTPGKQVKASWKWEMEDSGSLPPGAQIWWQWKATNEKGEKVTSEKKTITWIDKTHPWQVKEENNIRLHYYRISGQQADEFLQTALDAEKKLATDTGMVATGNIDLFMYQNTKEMRDAMLYEQDWTGGMAFTDFNKIVLGMEANNLEWTKRAEAHELTHVLVGNYTFTCLWTTPTWLEEGLAVYAEGEPDDDTKDLFDKAKENDDLLSFRILSASFSADSDKANLSYSQSYYMVNYLIEKYGRDKINTLLKTLSKGTTVDEALKEVYGFNLPGFEREWRASIGVPEAKWAAEAEKPTAVPTEIPTMMPITGLKKVIPTITSSPMPSATPLPSPTTEVAAPAAVENTAPTSTPIPQEQPAAQGSTTTTMVLVILGIIVAGVTIFVVIRSKNKKNTLISAIVIVFLLSAVLSTSPVKADNLAAAPTKFPQLPTATLVTPPPAEKGTYTNAAIGISLKIPTNASVDTSRADSSYHFYINIANNSVFGHLFSTSLGQGKTLQEIAKKIRDSQMNNLVGVEHLEDKEIEMDDGSKAWLTVSDGRNLNAIKKMRISFLTVRGYTQATTLMLFSSRDVYEYFQDEIDSLNTSIKVTAPVINGFSRDELLIEDGGESDNPVENDPATAHGSGDFYLTFTGLVTYDASMKLTPDLAKSWDVSDDGLVYTFHLQPEAVFHNMRPVTAEDVVYSWERAANPETKSGTVMTYLGDIQGIKDMHEGNAKHISGLKIIDEHTLQVTLEKPVPYFLLKLTYPTGYIVDKDNVEKSKTWYRTPNGTGPFRMTRWDSRKDKFYERFDAFYGEKPKIKAILITMYQGDSLQLFEQGMIDFTGISYDELSRFNDPSEPMHDQLQSNSNMCTSYITLDVTQPPFDDVKVRQAFAMAMDKEEYVKVIMNNGSLPAKGLYPPALPGYDKDFKGLEFNPEKARALLKESKYGSGELPPIIFSISGYGNFVPEGISAVAQMWEENLGIKITVQNIDPEYYQEVLDSGKHGQLISEGWCADYPDPENFADVLFHSGNEMNRGNYSNPELDKLLETARVEEDVNKRISMYSEAEKIIVNDVPAIFWTHSNSFVLVKPYLQGYVGTPIDVPLERFMWIDGEKFTK